MGTSYPGAVDSFSDPVATNPMNAPSHAGQHANANDALEAIETAIGTTGAFNFAPLVVASGDATGATDATNINAVLSARAVANLDGTYYINTKLLLAGANGLNMTARTVINWTGATNATAIGTAALSTNPAAFAGVLTGGVLFYAKAKITSAMTCVYIALPYCQQTITMAVSTGAVQSDQGSPISGAYAYDFDGCANPGPFRVFTNVYGRFQAGFRVRANHVTLDTCGSGVGGHHVEIDQDSVAFSANGPLNVTLVGGNHGYLNSASFLHLIKANAVVVNGGYNESGPSQTSNVVVLAESTFVGYCDVQDVIPGWDATLITHYSTTGYVRYRTKAGVSGYDRTFVGQSSGVPIVVPNLEANPEPVAVATVTTTRTLALGGNILTLTSGSNLTLTMPPVQLGAFCWVEINQPASGTTTNTVTQATSQWPGGTKPTMTTGASAQDRYDYFSDGTYWYGTITGQAFS